MTGQASSASSCSSCIYFTLHAWFADFAVEAADRGKHTVRADQNLGRICYGVTVARDGDWAHLASRAIFANLEV